MYCAITYIIDKYYSVTQATRKVGLRIPNLLVCLRLRFLLPPPPKQSCNPEGGAKSITKVCNPEGGAKYTNVWARFRTRPSICIVSPTPPEWAVLRARLYYWRGGRNIAFSICAPSCSLKLTYMHTCTRNINLKSRVLHAAKLLILSFKLRATSGYSVLNRICLYTRTVGYQPQFYVSFSQVSLVHALYHLNDAFTNYNC